MFVVVAFVAAAGAVIAKVYQVLQAQGIKMKRMERSGCQDVHRTIIFNIRLHFCTDFIFFFCFVAEKLVIISVNIKIVEVLKNSQFLYVNKKETTKTNIRVYLIGLDLSFCPPCPFHDTKNSKLHSAIFFGWKLD